MIIPISVPHPIKVVKCLPLFPCAFDSFRCFSLSSGKNVKISLSSTLQIGEMNVVHFVKRNINSVQNFFKM